MRSIRGPVVMAIAVAIVVAASHPDAAPLPATAQTAPLPQRLADTGLYADESNTTLRAGVLAFAPQYPLWSNGTRKRRWIWLPPGSAIDGSDPDAWDFPVGTRLWKEFGYGRPIETRFIERLADGTWRFVVYVRDEDGRDARLASASGVNVPVADAPGGRYRVPSRVDCVSCHEGAPVPVLGFSALQLSPDRDPNAPHAEGPRSDPIDLAALVERRLIANLPRAVLDSPPRIPAEDATTRAALGYLHGNCGHCHNRAGALPGVELRLAQEVRAPVESLAATLESLLGRNSRYREADTSASSRVVAGDASASIVARRMRSDNRLARMPPVGVEVIDAQGIALIERWITHSTHPTKEKSP